MYTSSGPRFNFEFGSFITLVSCVLHLHRINLMFIFPIHITTAFSVSSQAVGTSAYKFSRPLLDEGYPPAVIEYENNEAKNKPLLLYLPGFDGTLVCPFLQFPELNTEFDVHGLSIDMSDRSTFSDLLDGIVDYVISECYNCDPYSGARCVYLMGESFGGVLASAVTLRLKERAEIDISGLVLINPATCYDRSKLKSLAPPVAQLPMPQYLYGLMKLLPLFVDKYQFPQLLLMLSSEALPSIIDSPAREAYMGRIAFSLADKLKFMPRETLQWRLTKWLDEGSQVMTTDRLQILGENGGEVIVVVGENDQTLPYVKEAFRLQSIISDSNIHVVEGAGHASTSGSRVDLTALMRNRFQSLNTNGRTEMKQVAAKGSGKYFGMEPREVKEGLSPLRYWDEDLYRLPR